MDIFSDKEPNLIAPKIQKTVFKIIESKPEVVTISDKISNIVISFYKKFIENHKLLTLMIIVIVIFLLYRWYNRSGRRENFTENEYKILNNILTTQSADLRWDDQPTLNPLYSIKDQEGIVNYPPEPLPINIPGKGFVYARDLYNKQNEPELLNSPEKYDYNSHRNSASYYVGTYNTYNDVVDTDIINPLGFSNKFNTTTGNFIKGMTNKNKEVLNTLNNTINNKIGPDFLNPDEPELSMLPPYATEL